MTEHLLALDAGTTGVTALVFDQDLAPVARAYREFPQGFPQPGWVEHEARDILAALDVCLCEVLDGLSAPPVALGITNQRETVFPLDLSTGETLGPGIVWQDRRTAQRCRELSGAGHEDLYRARTGLRLDPYFSGTKIEWLLRERTGVAAAAAEGRVRFCTVDALIVHHLTGGARCATDPTNASRTLLFDIDERAWNEELCAPLGVHPDWMPEVLPSTGDFGTARLPGGIEVPIRGIAGDQQAALYGQGCWEPGSFKNTYGTGCFLLLNTGERRVDSERGLLTTLAAARDGSPCYALEGSVFSGGLVIQWLRDQLGLLTQAADSEALATSVEDSAGVFLVPAFAGLGAPYWDPDARAAILGLTRGAGKAHITRAALEAIAFQCAEVVEILRQDTGLPIESLLVDGGAAANDFLMQTQADLAGLEILRRPDVESTARGAAALAGVGVGLWSDPREAAAFQAPPTSFQPHLSESDRSQRMAAWRAAVERVRT
ncbi:MAG: glycerol kinase GlpK [Planctomycetota bacterium]